MKKIMAVLLLFGGFVHAQEKLVSKGEVFALFGKKKHFSYERFQKIQGDEVHSRSNFKDLKGKVVIKENIIFKKGEFLSYHMDQLQTGEKGNIYKKGDKIYFEKIGKDGDKDKDSEVFKKNFVVGMQFADYIKDHWRDLLSGKKIETRLGVWQRTETLGFRFKRNQEFKEVGRIQIMVDPTSMFVRSVVKTIRLTFDEKTKKLKNIKGRVAPKKMINGRWRDLEAYIVYK